MVSFDSDQDTHNTLATTENTPINLQPLYHCKQHLKLTCVLFDKANSKHQIMLALKVTTRFPCEVLDLRISGLSGLVNTSLPIFTSLRGDEETKRISQRLAWRKRMTAKACCECTAQQMRDLITAFSLFPWGLQSGYHFSPSAPRLGQTMFVSEAQDLSPQGRLCQVGTKVRLRIQSTSILNHVEILSLTSKGSN